MNDFASLFMRLAAWTIEKQDSEWARAMRAELEHVPARVRSSWAIGCLISAIKRRLDFMRIENFRVSRGVLLLELLVCFVPLTWGWWEVLFGSSNILRLNPALVEEHFLGSSLGIGVLGMMLGGVVIGIVGPIGLFLMSRAVMSGKGLGSRPWGLTMIAAVAGYAAASILLRLIAGPGAYAADLSFILLFGILPAAGIAHLMYLARTAPNDSARQYRFAAPASG